MTEHWPAASCPWSKSKWVLPWTLLAWLVTTTPPIPSTPFRAFRWEIFLLHHGMGIQNLFWPFLPYLKKYSLTYLAVLGLRCDTWDLVPWTGMESRPLILKMRSLHHWITWGIPNFFFLRNNTNGVCFLHQGPFPSVLALGNTIWNHKKNHWHVSLLSRVPWGGELGPEDNNNFIEKQTGLERKLSGPMEPDQPQYTVPSSCSAFLDGTAPGQTGQRRPTLEVYTAKWNPCKCLWVWYRQGHRSKDRCTGTFSCLQDLVWSFHHEHLRHRHLRCKDFYRITTNRL